MSDSTYTEGAGDFDLLNTPQHTKWDWNLPMSDNESYPFITRPLTDCHTVGNNQPEQRLRAYLKRGRS